MGTGRIQLHVTNIDFLHWTYSSFNEMSCFFSMGLASVHSHTHQYFIVALKEDAYPNMLGFNIHDNQEATLFISY